MKTILFSLSFTLMLWGCDKGASTQARWYTPAQVAQGKVLFQQNCMACHGDKAQGLTANWDQQNADGSYPAPPLNGSAHAWHHPLSALKYTIREGGIRMGGSMPAFGDKLTPAEQEAIIAYFQSFWSDNIYSAWLVRGGLGKQ